MLPYAYPAGLGPDSIAGTTVVLPANGGAIAMPLFLTDQLCAQQIVVQTVEVGGQHTLEVMFFDARAEPQGELQIFTYGNGTAIRTANLARPVYVGPGLAWVIARNVGNASSTLGAVAPGTLGGNACFAATLPNSLPDLSGAAWAAVANTPLVRVKGSVMSFRPGEVI